MLTLLFLALCALLALFVLPFVIAAALEALPLALMLLFCMWCLHSCL